MKCRKCGKPLDETDKFCRNCGARVIKNRLNSAADYRTRKQEGTTEDSEAHRNTFRGYTPPQEKFNWNTREFPGAPHPTEDVDFNWNTFDAFHRDRDEQQKPEQHHKEGDEIAFAPDPGTNTFQEDRKAPLSAISPKESGTTAASMGIESSGPQEKKDASSLQTSEGDVTGSELEQELFRDIRETSPAMDAEERKKQTAEIDQFYTFNRKNEEFQRLLDREYEKYRAGRPALEPEDREERDRLEEERGAMEIPGDLPESNANVFQKKVIPPQQEKPDPVVRQSVPRDTERHSPAEQGRSTAASGQNAADALQHERAGKEKPAGVSTAKIQRRVHEAESPSAATPSETAPSAAAPSATTSPAASQDGGARTKQNRRRAVWTIAAVLIIIALILAAIHLIAPDSAAGEKIGAIPHLFSGQEKTKSRTEEDHSKPEEDLTRSIQKESGQNQNQAIREMNYNAALRYDGTATYADHDIKNSKALKTNLFYVENGEKHYLNDAIVGEAIRYCSSRIKKGRTLDSFEMGEIRKGKNGYYLWVSENDRKAIFRFDPAKHQMHVTKVYKL